MYTLICSNIYLYSDKLDNAFRNDLGSVSAVSIAVLAICNEFISSSTP